MTTPLKYLPSVSRSCLLLLALSAAADAQLASSAYRVLGQLDLRHNGVNLVQGIELNAPGGIAIDNRNGQARIYISDTVNSRVLAWSNITSYQAGDPPALVLGQPGPQFSTPLGIGTKGFNSPLGLAVDPATGNLYVADYNDNRVLRFPAPFNNPTRIEPDLVFGQPNFSNRSAGVSKSLMNHPRALAFDPAGNLWVADAGNNRLLRFNFSVLDSQTPPDADALIGQKDFSSSTANRGGNISASGFDTPSGIAFDAQGNMYVSDFSNTRVLRFNPLNGPVSADTAAAGVIGQADFVSRGVPTQATSSSLAGPAGLAIDGNGNLYIAVPGDSRVLVFSVGATSSGARSVLGQSDFITTTANVNVFPQASPNTLSLPADVKVDSSGNIYVADTGNNRVLGYPAGSKSANKVWGQTDFTGNGANQVKPGSLASPYKVAIDYSQSPYAIYVSDLDNNRVLGWRDSVRFRNGDPADIVIGQPDMRTAIANVDTRGSQNPSRTSLSRPSGIAVEPGTGALFVADTANNRVLRYPRPIAQSGRQTPDIVIGQVDFTSSASAAVNNASLRSPVGLAFGPDGNLFVADLGNNRVLEFASGVSTHSSAIRVYGQPNFNTSLAASQVSAQTLTGPQGVFVDGAFNLYVADTGANRVLIFPNTQNAPPAGAAAAFVIGPNRFDITASSIFKSPSDVGADSAGVIYVSDSANNRVLQFQSLVFLPVTGATASGVIGQSNTSGTSPNFNTPDGLATPESLYDPLGIFFDRQDTLYIADSVNSRVLHFLKPAAGVNAATFQASVPVAPGSIVTLFGAGMADRTQTVTSAPWPISVAGREVVVNDEIRAPLYSVSPTQVSLQLPGASPLGSSRVAVRLADTGELIAGGSILVAATAPGLFSAASSGSGQAAALNSDGRVNSSGNAAAKGSVISLFGTGQGQVSPAVADGAGAPSGPLSSTVAVPTSDGRACVTTQPSMCVAVGSGFGEIQYSGLAPGLVGLWQINVKLPADVAAGNVNVRVVINGTPSNLVTIAVR